MRETVLCISRAALQHNLRRVRECMPSAYVMAMIKADAYGHGAVRCAQALQDEAAGFAVACRQLANHHVCSLPKPFWLPNLVMIWESKS